MARATPPELFEAWESGTIGVDDLRRVIAAVWTHSEQPERALDPSSWVRMFRAVGFIDESALAVPRTQLRLYRGAGWDDRSGMSWTTSIMRAAALARRSQPGWVFAVHVSPDAMLACIRTEDADEIVVDPFMLPPIGKTAAVAGPV